MVICAYCGAEEIDKTAPCGVNGCTIKICCADNWLYKHCKLWHKEYYKKEIKKLVP